MIKVICVGKIKEDYYRKAVCEYLKRLSRYVKLELIEVEDSCNGEIDKIKNNEAKEIKKYLQNKDYIVTLDIGGQMYDSIEFAKFIDNNVMFNNLVFIIGGSYGLSDEIKNLSNKMVSFSNLTFPHQLFRVILLEQIYRAYKIINNEEYHK